MSQLEELDEFRRQWKDDLKQKRKLEATEPEETDRSIKQVKHANVTDNDKSKDGTSEIDLMINDVASDIINSTQRSSQFKSSVLRGDSNSKVDGKLTKNKRFLDIFIEDLNEINEIPFFDLEIPREIGIKIFQHLSMKDLCNCAMVSKAWKSLAEDELLWCDICQKLGYEQSLKAVDNENWKDIVKQAFQMEQMLTYNWKNCIGNVEELSYIPGGVLTAVNSFKDWVLAGYTSLEAKLWNLETEAECVLMPSTVALVPQEDESFVHNSITGVAGNDQFSAAIFGTGMVDIWDNSSKHTSPLYTYNGLPHGNTSVIKCSDDNPTVAVSYGKYIRVDSQREGEWGDEHSSSWGKVEVVSYGEEEISDFLLLSNKYSSQTDNKDILVVAVDDQVKVHSVSGSEADITQIYHTAFVPVKILDNRGEEIAMCVCKNIYSYHELVTSLDDRYQIQLYSLQTGREITKLPFQQQAISVINTRDSPPNMVVAGGYKNVSLYDCRICDKVLSINTNNGMVTRVQVDDWKIVVGGQDGFVCVWDQRITHSKLWDIHNRHPVKYMHFKKNILVAANIPSSRDFIQDRYQEDNMLHRRYQGSIYVKDFSVSQQRGDLPGICQSTFDEPERYNYNVRLTVPYDSV